VAIRQGWGGRPVRQEQAQGILVAALGILAAQHGYDRGQETGWPKVPGDGPVAHFSGGLLGRTNVLSWLSCSFWAEIGGGKYVGIDGGSAKEQPHTLSG
jgi:hypothetical protein